MPTWIFLVLVAITGNCLRHLEQLQTVQKKWTDKLSKSTLSHIQLWLCSRAFLLILLIDCRLFTWYPIISMPIGYIVIIFIAYAAIHCIVGLFALAAYDLVKPYK